MSFQQRDMSGALFKNDKQGNPNRPDYTGTAMVEGTEYRLSAWIKQGKQGPFMSLAFQLPKPKDQPVSKVGDNEAPDFDDSLPFAWAFISVVVAGSVYAQDLFQVWV